MFSSRKAINLIIRIHKKSLITVDYDAGTDFQESLQLSKGISV